MALLFVDRLRTWCVYCILGFSGLPIGSIVTPFFVDRLRTWCMCPILGLPLVLIGSIARPLFVDRLRTSRAYLILGFPLAPSGLIVTLFYVPRLRTCCVYLILGFLRAPAGPTLAVYGDPLTLSRLHFVCAGCGLAACSLPRALVDSTTAHFIICTGGELGACISFCVPQGLPLTQPWHINSADLVHVSYLGLPRYLLTQS